MVVRRNKKIYIVVRISGGGPGKRAGQGTVTTSSGNHHWSDSCVRLRTFNHVPNHYAIMLKGRPVAGNGESSSANQNTPSTDSVDLIDTDDPVLAHGRVQEQLEADLRSDSPSSPLVSIIRSCIVLTVALQSILQTQTETTWSTFSSENFLAASYLHSPVIRCAAVLFRQDT